MSPDLSPIPPLHGISPDGGTHIMMLLSLISSDISIITALKFELNATESLNNIESVHD